ncbi:MAG: 50S ribosomal protein L10 [Candidatus Eisenbacteria bacterium]|nr:50S ribosomal protein L10 [Candidatus Eisenbacteria bacterium]
MPMMRAEKEARVEELTKFLQGNNVILLSDFTGLDVETATEIRRRFREESVEFRVVKNTLARLAARQVGLNELAEYLEGPNAVVLSKDDPVAPAKILAEFEKKNDSPKIKRGWVESVLMSEAQIRQLAELPPKEVLLAQIAAGFQAPVAGFTRLLHEMLRQLVSVLDEVGKTKGAASGA